MKKLPCMEIMIVIRSSRKITLMAVNYFIANIKVKVHEKEENWFRHEKLSNFCTYMTKTDSPALTLRNVIKTFNVM